MVADDEELEYPAARLAVNAVTSNELVEAMWKVASADLRIDKALMDSTIGSDATGVLSMGFGANVEVEIAAVVVTDVVRDTVSVTTVAATSLFMALTATSGAPTTCGVSWMTGPRPV